MKFTVLVTASLLLLSGCNTETAEPTPTQYWVTPTQTSTATTTPTSTPTSTPTIVSTPTPEPTLPPVTRQQPVAQQAPAADPPNSNVDWRAIVAQYDWNYDEAIAVIMCESGGNPNSVNIYSGATGLFQIHPGSEAYKDPATNISIGYAKWLDGVNNKGNRWWHWNQFGSCGHFY